MDFSGQMANRAYLDLAADVRMAFFAEHGFPPSEFRRLGFGPVVRKDELECLHELGLHESVPPPRSGRRATGAVRESE